MSKLHKLQNGQNRFRILVSKNDEGYNLCGGNGRLHYMNILHIVKGKQKRDTLVMPLPLYSQILGLFEEYGQSLAATGPNTGRDIEVHVDTEGKGKGATTSYFVNVVKGSARQWVFDKPSLYENVPDLKVFDR